MIIYVMCYICLLQIYWYKHVRILRVILDDFAGRRQGNFQWARLASGSLRPWFCSFHGHPWRLGDATARDRTSGFMAPSNGLWVSWLVPPCETWSATELQLVGSNDLLFFGIRLAMAESRFWIRLLLTSELPRRAIDKASDGSWAAPKTTLPPPGLTISFQLRRAPLWITVLALMTSWLNVNGLCRVFPTILARICGLNVHFDLVCRSKILRAREKHWEL